MELTPRHILLVLHAPFMGSFGVGIVLHPYFAVIAPEHRVALPFLRVHEVSSDEMPIIARSSKENKGTLSIQHHTSVILKTRGECELLDC